MPEVSKNTVRAAGHDRYKNYKRCSHKLTNNALKGECKERIRQISGLNLEKGQVSTVRYFLSSGYREESHSRAIQDITTHPFMQTESKAALTF